MAASGTADNTFLLAGWAGGGDAGETTAIMDEVKAEKEEASEEGGDEEDEDDAEAGKLLFCGIDDAARIEGEEEEPCGE